MGKILVVDDSETLRGQVRLDLEAVGHTVIEAHDGVHGLEVIEENEGIDLIILDVNMPRLDGLSMCMKLFERTSGKSPHIFMLTTECSPWMKTKGKSVGVTAWVTKPYVREKMIAAVARILDRKVNPSS